MDTPAEIQSGYISGRSARIRLGLTNYKLLKFVALGHIRTQALPGSSIRYCLVDVEKILADRTAGS